MLESYAQFQSSSTTDTYGAGKELGAQSQSVLAQIEEFTSSSRGNEQSPWKKCCKYFSLSVRYSARQAPHSSSMIGLFLIKITDVTGHKSLEMLKTYSRDAEAFVGHAGAGLL
jgi:hypothetical protein